MYNGKKWFVPDGSETVTVKVVDDWGNTSVTEKTNFRMTRAYKHYLTSIKPLEDMKKEYYDTKKSCQYQFARYGEIDSVDEMRLKSLKCRIVKWLNNMKSVDLEDAVEFLGYREK